MSAITLAPNSPHRRGSYAFDTAVVAASDASSLVKAYSGWVCDGVADDVQINAALASGAARVFLPEGTYVIAGTISVPSNTELFGAGPGTIIKMRDEGELALTAYTWREIHGLGQPNIRCMIVSDQAGATTGIYLHDFTVNGNGAHIVTTDYKLAFAGIALYNCTYSMVERVNGYDCNHLIASADIGNWRNFCIVTAKASHITIRDGKWGDAGYETIGVRGDCSDILIDGCRISRHASTRYGRHGIQISTPAGEAACKNVTVCNTYHEGQNGWLIVHSASGVSIYGSNFAVPSSGDGFFGITLNVCSNVTIDNCRFYGTNPTGTDMLDRGIYLLAYSATEYPENVVISNCIMYTGGQCIDISAGRKISVIANQLRSTRRRGIDLSYDAPGDDLGDILISGNHFQCDTYYDGLQQCIRCQNVEKASILDNKFVAANNVACLNLDASTNVRVERNNFTFSGSGSAITLANAPTWTARGNVGFVDSASGTATVPNGATYIDVTHGLGFTPTAKQIICNPTNNLGSAAMWWLTDLGATTFRINVDADPGATTATFSWQARMDV
jgi:hypothetical protein